MDLHVCTVRDRSRTRVGSREAIPHWGMGARAALGVLASMALGSPFALLSLAAWTVAEPKIGSVLALASYATLIFYALLTVVFASFVIDNPRIYGLRTIWLIGLITAPPLTLPIYWWTHVWNAPYLGERREDDGPGKERAPRRLLIDSLVVAGRTRARFGPR